jgi:hypothetical protein
MTMMTALRHHGDNFSVSSGFVSMNYSPLVLKKYSSPVLMGMVKNHAMMRNGLEMACTGQTVSHSPE